MFGPSKIMKWCEVNLQGVRRSRLRTLSCICAGAMKMKGVGVLADMGARIRSGVAIARARESYANADQTSPMEISTTTTN